MGDADYGSPGGGGHILIWFLFFTFPFFQNDEVKTKKLKTKMEKWKIKTKSLCRPPGLTYTTDGTFRRGSWSDTSWFSPKTAEYWYALWLIGLWRGSHCMSVYGSFFESTVPSLYCGHCRDLQLVSSLARVRNSRSLFQSNVCLAFSCCPYYRSVRYSGVSARRELTLKCRCAVIYTTPGTCLVTATNKIGEKETNTSFPIFHTRHNFIKVLRNNTKNSLTWNWDNLFQSSSNPICHQVLHPNSTHCCQIPSFPRTSASHSNTLGSPGWGWGSKLILLFDHNRH